MGALKIATVAPLVPAQKLTGPSSLEGQEYGRLCPNQC